MSAATYSREQVRSDAVAAGHSPAVAAYIASQIGLDTRKVLTGEQRSKPPAAPVPLSRSLTGKPTARTAAPRASLTTGTRPRLSAMCALYGAQALAADFERAGVPLCRVASLLEEAKTTSGQIGVAGLARIRFQLSL